MIKLELTEQMFSVIANALGNLPFKDAAPVIAEVQRQINVQRAPMPQPSTNGGTEAPAPQ
jgi:hypothetical protein